MLKSERQAKYVFVAGKWHKISRTDLAYETPCGYSAIPDDPGHLSHLEPKDNRCPRCLPE